MSERIRNPWTLSCPYCGRTVELDASEIRWHGGADGAVRVEAEFLAFHRCNPGKVEQ